MLRLPLFSRQSAASAIIVFFVAAIAFYMATKEALTIVQLDNARVRVGETAQLSIGVCNNQFADVSILGAKVSCSCTEIPELPVEIAPWETVELSFKVSAEDRHVGDQFDVRVRLLAICGGRKLSQDFSIRALVTN